MTFFRNNNKYVPVCCGFACLGWGKLTLTKKFLFGLKMAWDQELSSGLILLTFTLTLLFQFRFADTEPCWLFTSTFFRLKKGRAVKIDGPFKGEHQPHCFLRTYMPGCQRRHLRQNAPVQGFAWYVACCCVLFERWYMDIENLQTHHIRQFLVKSNGVASPTTALVGGIKTAR